MNGMPPSILVIDADAASRNYLATVLRKSQYTVLLAGSGKEGLIIAWQNLPNLILIDPVLPDTSGADLIIRLRQDHRTANVPCVALSSQEKADEVTALLSAGFNEFLVKSSDATAKILELVPRLLRRESVPRKNGLLVVFLSAKGGMGTSSLCANIAMCTGKQYAQKRVAVLDLVLPLGSIANIVGYVDRLNLFTVAAQNAELTTPLYFKENLPKMLPWYFRLLAGAPDPESANQLPISRIPEIISAMQVAYDTVFVDLGRSLSRISIPILQLADVIVLIVGSDVSTIMLTRAVWDYLKTQGIGAQNVYVILNRAIGLEGLTKLEIDRMLNLEVRIMVPYMGGNFALANNRHEPVATKFPNDSATLMLKQAAAQIVELGQKLRAK